MESKVTGKITGGKNLGGEFIKKVGRGVRLEICGDLFDRDVFTSETGMIESRISELVWTVQDAKFVGVLVGRSINALSKIGISIVSVPDWDSNRIETQVVGLGKLPNDLVNVVDVLFRISRRSTFKINPTNHPLSIFDFKQAIGITSEIRLLKDKSAQELDRWISERELAELQTKVGVNADADSDADSAPKFKGKGDRETKNGERTKAREGKKRKSENKKVRTASLIPVPTSVSIPDSSDQGNHPQSQSSTQHP